MPPTPSTPASRLLARSFRLSSRLLARRQTPRTRLAARVAERRRPHVARIARRLWRAPAHAPVFAPEGMSDFASRWIFGDGRAEGTPLADSEARAALAGATGPPSFQEGEPAPAEEAPTWPSEVPSAATLARTPVEEFGARRAQGFRLSSTPAPATSAPATPEVEPARSEVMSASPEAGPASQGSGPQPAGQVPPAHEFATAPAAEELAAELPGEPPVSHAAAPKPARAPVRPVVARSASTSAPAAARPGPPPVRVVAGPTRVPAPATPAPAAVPVVAAAARPGILRRALNAAGAALARRGAPAPPPPASPATTSSAPAASTATVARTAVAPEPPAATPEVQLEIDPRPTDATPGATSAVPVEQAAARPATPVLARHAGVAPEATSPPAVPGPAERPFESETSAVEPQADVTDAVESIVAAGPQAHYAGPATAPEAPAAPAPGLREEGATATPAPTPQAPATPARAPLGDLDMPAEVAPDEVVPPSSPAPAPLRTSRSGFPTASASMLRVTPAGAAVARTPAPARPLLRAERRVRSTPVASRDAGIRATSGARLARALGLPLVAQAEGSVSVSLDAAGAPSAPMAATQPMLARAPDSSDAEVAPTPTPTPTPAPAAPAPAAPAGAPAPTLEDIYEHVVERLRRDLLVERERMGDLSGRLP